MTTYRILSGSPVVVSISFLISISSTYADWLDVKVLEIEIKNEMDTTTGDPDKIRYVVIHANLTGN